jgi:hypothetical protein
VWLAIGLTLLPGTLLGLLGLILLLFGVGVFVLPVAFVLFIAGLAASIYIFVQAQAADDI